MLKLVKLEEKYRRHLTEMMEEWYEAEEPIIPYSIRKNDYRDFDFYLEHLDISEEAAAGSSFVPDSTFFCLDTDRDLFVGAVIRTTGLAGGLLCPYKGLIPAYARKAH